LVYLCDIKQTTVLREKASETDNYFKVRQFLEREDIIRQMQGKEDVVEMRRKNASKSLF
jgi:hypothetical protein